MDMILTNITVFVTPSFIGSLRKKQIQLHTIIYFDNNNHVANLTNRKKMLIKVSNIFTLEKLLQDKNANYQFESKFISYLYTHDNKKD